MPNAAAPWSQTKVNVVTGLVGFAGLAALMAIVSVAGSDRVRWLGSPAGIARWTVVVAALWAISFVRTSPTIAGYKKRTSLPLWLVAPWVPLALGTVEWAGSLLYYLPMVAGFSAMIRAGVKRDTARAVSMPGLTWSEAAGDVTLTIPNGAEARRALQAAGKDGVLLRGEFGPGSEVELLPGAPLGAFIDSTVRLTVICPPDSQHLALWGSEPVTWTLKRGVG